MKNDEKLMLNSFFQFLVLIKFIITLRFRFCVFVSYLIDLWIKLIWIIYRYCIFNKRIFVKLRRYIRDESVLYDITVLFSARF